MLTLTSASHLRGACKPVPAAPILPKPPRVVALDIPPWFSIPLPELVAAAKKDTPIERTLYFDLHKMFPLIPADKLNVADLLFPPGNFAGTLDAYMQAALANSSKLLPLLQRYPGHGKDLAAANRLARAVIAPEMVFQRYYRRVPGFLKDRQQNRQQGGRQTYWGTHYEIPKAKPNTFFRDADHLSYDALGRDFVASYTDPGTQKKLVNPYGGPLYLPLITGKTFIMEVQLPPNLQLPAPDAYVTKYSAKPKMQIVDGVAVPTTFSVFGLSRTQIDEAYQRTHRWVLTAKWLGGPRFTFTLTRIINSPSENTFLGDVGRGIAHLVEFIGDEIRDAIAWMCGKITDDDLQQIRNAAGAVPEPTTQVAVKAWEAAAMVCDMAFPAKTTASCEDATPPAAPPSLPPAPSWFEANQKWVILGGAGLVAVLAARTLLPRR